MYSEIKVVNKEHTEFDFTWIRVKTKFKVIVFNCVHDNRSDSYAWMDEHNSEDTLIVFWEALNITNWDITWVKRLNGKIKNNKSHFLYLTGSEFDSNLYKSFNIEFNVKYFTAHDIKVVDQWNRDHMPGPFDINIHKYKQFSYLNKKDTVSNRYILSRLYQSNIIDNGAVSYHTMANEIFDKSVGFTDAGFEYIKMQCRNIPLVATDLVWLRDKHYQTYVNIVTEPENFITENTFKALGSNQIFFIVGKYKSLELLRRLGYKTFDAIIDESYDDIESDQERLFTVTREIVSFLSRTEDQILGDYKKVITNIEHNRDLLFKQTLKSKMQQFFDSNIT